MSYGNDTYSISSRMDPKFPNMDPIYCLIPLDRAEDDDTYKFDRVCMVRSGDAFGYPHLNHVGLSGDDSNTNNYYDQTLGCSCSPVAAIDANTDLVAQGVYGDDHYCDKFDLMHGLVIFNSKYADVMFKKILAMATQKTAKEINDAAYFPAFGALRIGGNAGKNQQTITDSDQNTFNDLLDIMQPKLPPTAMPTPVPTPGGGPSPPTTPTPGGVPAPPTTPTPGGVPSPPTPVQRRLSADLQSPFDFCVDTSCVILSVNTYDSYDQRINKHFFDLVDANCNNPFTLDDLIWRNDTDETGPYYEPPTALVIHFIFVATYNAHASSLFFIPFSFNDEVLTIYSFF